MIAILSAERDIPPGVVHCFSGTVPDAARYRKLGLKLSIPGVVTFKKPGALPDAIAATPVEHLLVETDAPYLAPEPHRGKRNEPAFVVEVVRKIATLVGLSFDDVARVTAVNARALFGVDGGAKAGGGDAMQFVYPIRDSLYVNLTDSCTIHCRFCPKWDENYVVKGHNIRLSHEPSSAEVLAALAAAGLARYRELVFCGLGEPTFRLDVLKDVARAVRAQGTGIRIRLDTDGLGSLLHKRDIVPELVGLIDEVSVSLNAADGVTYARLCPSDHGEAAFDAVKSFIMRARAVLPRVRATAVAVPKLNLDRCREVAEVELGVSFVARPFGPVG